MPDISLRPKAFHWNESELDAFNKHGLTTGLTYARWCYFVDYLIDLFTWYETIDLHIGDEYNSYTKNQTYRNMLEDAKTYDDKIISAFAFNNVRYVIGSHYPTGIKHMEKGDICCGEYFKQLQHCANQII